MPPDFLTLKSIIYLKRKSSIKMRIKFIFAYIVIVMLIITGCSTATVKSEADLITADEENITHLMGLINKYNSNSLNSYILQLNVEGHSGTQKFKAGGNVRYNNLPRRMKIVFHDAILQSPITEIIQEDDVLRFYFPLEKALYIENINKIDLKAYTNFNLDFNLISDLLCGKIPVIKLYRVYKGLESETDPVIKGNKLIILENDEFFETISFSKDVPDKILWVNKNSKERIELYLRRPVLKDNFLFYQEAKIISRKSDLNILIQFSSIKFNVPVDPENITKRKYPKDMNIIKRD
jgi:hypothetical protein